MTAIRSGPLWTTAELEKTDLSPPIILALTHHPLPTLLMIQGFENLL
jgi:hypothetical protein